MKEKLNRTMKVNCCNITAYTPTSSCNPMQIEPPYVAIRFYPNGTVFAVDSLGNEHEVENQQPALPIIFTSNNPTTKPD